MKYLFILLLPVLLFGQFANNLVQNPGMESSFTDTWAIYSTPPTFEQSSAQKHGGTYSLHVISDGSGKGARTALAAPLAVTSGATYRYSFWRYVHAGSFYTIDLSNLLNHYQVQSGSVDSWVHTKLSIISQGTGSEYLRLLADGGTDEFYVDDVFIGLEIDTLFIFSSGSDTDNDTVKTLSEAFELRGSHPGGTFITESGTWDESITIDSSFTLWSTATAGQTVTVTTVDFNNVTATVLDVYVTNASNDGNITYTYTPSATTDTERKFRNYNNWSGFKP